MTTTALAILLQLAVTAPMTVQDGDEVTIPVSPSGVTLQLPDFVRVVTPSPEYSVRPLVPPRPAPHGGGNGAAAPDRTDVRVFLVRWAKPDPGEHAITFVLADSRSVGVRLLPGSNRDDSFVDLRWARRGGSTGRGRGGDPFLAAERALLLSMLRDERLPSRKVLDQQVELPAYPELEVKLVRTYDTPEGLVGGVYTFTNRSEKTVVVNQTVLAVGTPNRAVLTQMDHAELRPCSDNDSTDPRGTACMSVVRIVSRADRADALGTPGGDRGAAMPFVLQPKEKER